MTHEEVVHRVCQVVAKAIPADSGATVDSLLVDLMQVLAPAGFYPVAEIVFPEEDDEPDFTDNVVPLRRAPH